MGTGSKVAKCIRFVMVSAGGSIACEDLACQCPRARVLGFSRTGALKDKACHAA